MASVADWLGNTEKFAYDPNSNLISTTLPASTKEVDTQAFDAADNLISMLDKRGNETLASFTYVRDANNQVTRETDHFGGSQSEGDQVFGDGQSQGNGQDGQGSKTYTYTPLNQLAKVNGSSYKYSSADNLIRLINGTTQTFDAANQLLSAATKGGLTTAYSYSQNGNRISSSSPDKATTLGYDQANRLVSFSSVSTKDQSEKGSSKTTTVAASYSYNGDGLRMSKTVGAVRSAMSWDVAEGLPLLLSDSVNQFVYGPGGLPLEQIPSSGTTAYLHHDQLGSTRLITDTGGHIGGEFTFDPYGNLSNSHGSTNTPLLFAGQYLDSESGLYYLRARYYEPQSAQFLSVDPVASSGNRRFGYAAGNPLNGIDPSGLLCMGVFAGAQALGGFGNNPNDIELMVGVCNGPSGWSFGLVATAASGPGLVIGGYAGIGFGAWISGQANSMADLTGSGTVYTFQTAIGLKALGVSVTIGDNGVNVLAVSPPVVGGGGFGIAYASYRASSLQMSASYGGLSASTYKNAFATALATFSSLGLLNASSAQIATIANRSRCA